MWALDASHTAANALVTLDISSQLQFLDLSGLSDAIQLFLNGSHLGKLTIPSNANIEALPQVQTLALTANTASIPTWVNQLLSGYTFLGGNFPVYINPTLDLSLISGSAEFMTLDFTTNTNSAIKTMILGGEYIPITD